MDGFFLMLYGFLDLKELHEITLYFSQYNR